MVAYEDFVRTLEACEARHGQGHGQGQGHGHGQGQGDTMRRSGVVSRSSHVDGNGFDGMRSTTLSSSRGFRPDDSYLGDTWLHTGQRSPPRDRDRDRGRDLMSIGEIWADAPEYSPRGNPWRDTRGGGGDGGGGGGVGDSLARFRASLHDYPNELDEGSESFSRNFHLAPPKVADSVDLPLSSRGGQGGYDKGGPSTSRQGGRNRYFFPESPHPNASLSSSYSFGGGAGAPSPWARTSHATPLLSASTPSAPRTSPSKVG